MANKSVNKVAVATKHPGVFMQTSELETETGQVLSTKAVDIDEKTEDFQLEKNETEVPEEIEFDEEEEEEMNLSDDQHVLPESDRIDETYDENEMKNGQIEENFDEKNDSLVCDESVEDIDDEEMEPLSLSDDDSAEEVEKEAKKKKNNRKIERNENCGYWIHLHQIKLNIYNGDLTTKPLNTLNIPIQILYSNSPLFNCPSIITGLRYVMLRLDHCLNSQPFDILTILDHLNTGLVRYSDLHCTIFGLLTVQNLNVPTF
jgi:hypothetical protein